MSGDWRSDLVTKRGFTGPERELLAMLRDRTDDIGRGIDAALREGTVNHARPPLALWRETAPGVAVLEALLEGR
jgi:hypothetical protein